jgi:hypothetical protein
MMPTPDIIDSTMTCLCTFHIYLLNLPMIKSNPGSVTGVTHLEFLRVLIAFLDALLQLGELGADVVDLLVQTQVLLVLLVEVLLVAQSLLTRLNLLVLGQVVWRRVRLASYQATPNNSVKIEVKSSMSYSGLVLPHNGNRKTTFVIKTKETRLQIN